MIMNTIDLFAMEDFISFRILFYTLYNTHNIHKHYYNGGNVIMKR